MLPTFREDARIFIWLHRITDLLIPPALLSIIIYSMNNIDNIYSYGYIGLLGGLLFLLTAQLIGLYRAWRGRSLSVSVKLVIQAWLITWVTLIVLAFFYKGNDQLSRLALLIWAMLTPIAHIVYRFIIRQSLSHLSSYGKNVRSIAILGAGKTGKQIASSLAHNQWLGYQIKAFYDDNPALLNQTVNGIPVIGTSDHLIAAARQSRYSEIYLCLPLHAEGKIKDILNELSDTTTIVKFIPDLFSFDLMHARWMEIEGIPIVSVYDTPLNSLFARMVKRGEDIVLSVLILLLISPLMLILASAVKLTSPGPVIFKQTRYGLNGQRINIYKFRSMTTQDNGSEIKQASINDRRITPLGALLRQTSLDELPQFFNVLQGKMSIVGPRPHAVAHNEEYRRLIPKYMQRHLVKPGITGWAQVNGWRGETDTLDKMQKRIDFDLHYIKNWSLWFDIKIIVLTLYKGFIHKNAR